MKIKKIRKIQGANEFPPRHGVPIRTVLQRKKNEQTGENVHT